MRPNLSAHSVEMSLDASVNATRAAFKRAPQSIGTESKLLRSV